MFNYVTIRPGPSWPRRAGLHYVGRVDDAPIVDPWELAKAHTGLPAHAHRRVGRALSTPSSTSMPSRRAAGRTHCHSFEAAHWVLEGEPAVLWTVAPCASARGTTWRCRSACRMRWANPGGDPVTLAVGQHAHPPGPVRRPSGHVPAAAGARWGPATAPLFGGPTARLVGHYEGTPPQMEALKLKDRPRGRPTAGLDTALVVYSGISVKMMVDATLGAALLTMFTVDYEPGGSAQTHDHPFEEAYLFMEGEVEGEFEGKRTRSAGRRGMGGRGRDARLLQRRHHARALAGDAGAPATRPSFLSLVRRLEEAREAAR